MEKSILTVVVTGAASATVLEALRDADIGIVTVLSEGDIHLSDKDLATLPSQIWLYEPDVNNEREFLVVAHCTSREGPALPADALKVIQQFGVIVEFNATYPDSSQYDSPAYAAYAEATQAEASTYGIPVSPDLERNLSDGDDGSEVRWLRIAMPSWFSLKP